MSDRVVAADFYCGAGGLSYGLTEAGIDVRLGVDFDPWCAYPFTTNCDAMFLEEDVRRVTARVVRRTMQRSDVRVFSACAPCQPYSEVNMQRAAHSSRGDSSLKVVNAILAELKPDIFVMENVPGVVRSDAFLRLIWDLEHAGYAVATTLINTRDYGLAQRRSRVVVMASRISKKPPKLRTKLRHENTVRSVIGELPKISAGETHSDDPLHRAAKLSDLNLRRVRTSRPGGTWRDWPANLRLDCHASGSGSGFSEAYGRMRWNGQAPTITTKFFNYGSGRFGHPSQHRALSIREGALLQGFPKGFEFAEDERKVPMGIAARLIGNAVPPPLGYAIGQAIMTHIRGVAQDEAA